MTATFRRRVQVALHGNAIGTQTAWRARTCPTCDAPPGHSCRRLSLNGDGERRRKTPHPARQHTPSRNDSESPVSSATR